MMCLGLALKATVVLGVGLVTSYVLPKHQTRLRHAACVLALLAAVLLLIGLLIPTMVYESPFVFSVSASQAVIPGPFAFDLTRLWMTGTLVMFLRFLCGVAYLAYLSKQGVSVETGVLLADVKTPMVWGWIRPQVLMPRWSTEWSEERWRLSLQHERTHVQRGDVWTASLGSLAEAVYWFHPLVWMLTARLREEQEIACDEQVLEAGNEGVRYAAMLVESAAEGRPASLLGCRMTGGVMKKRVERALQFQQVRMWSSRKRWAGIAICALCLAMAGVLAPAAEEGPYKIGGDVSSPKVIYKQEPKYTRAARKAKASGVVVLSIVVSSEGHPKDIAIIKSLRPDLDKQAIKAVQTWRFDPAQRDGHAVAVKANVEVNFRLL